MQTDANVGETAVTGFSATLAPGFGILGGDKRSSSGILGGSGEDGFRLSNKLSRCFLMEKPALTHTRSAGLQCLSTKPDLPRSVQAQFPCRIPSKSAAPMRPGECKISLLHMFGQYLQLQDAA